jgi:hypothetical protein
MADRRRYLNPMPSPLHPLPLRQLAPLLLALVLLAAFARNATATPAFYDANSTDGKAAVFSSKERMVPGDTDQEEDVYVRSLDTGLGEYVTREVSIGPNGGNDAQAARFDGMSSDGNEVVFSTREPMVAADTDQKEDVYLRNLLENRTILVSQGATGCTTTPNCGNGAFDSIFVPGGFAVEGSVVYFETAERLDNADTDSALDLYVRDVSAQTTKLVTTPDPSCVVCVSEAREAQFRGTDEDGGSAFFTTTERLATGDNDSGKSDIYARDIGAATTNLVSVPGICPPLQVGQNCEPSYGGASADGSHVFFETNEQLSAGDSDSFQDVYDWSGGASAALASTGPDGGNGEAIVTYAGTTPTGSTVYFETGEKLDATADGDQAQDVYQRSGGVTSLVSAGEGGKGNLAIPASFEWVSSAGGPVVVFTTAEALTAEDGDGAQDVYERSGSSTTLVSIGPDGGDGNTSATFAGASEDGSKIFLSTAEPLLAADTDSSNDVYLRTGGETMLISSGPAGGNGTFSAGLRGVSSDGSRAFFTTQERLTVDDDFANESDIYSWSGSGTLLVSVKNSPDLVLGPPPPTLEGTTPDSPNQSTTPTIFGQAATGSLVKIYKSFDCSGEPVAQGTAVQLASPGLTVTVPVPLGATVSYRATAEAEGIVSACSSPIAYKQEDPPPPAEEGGGGGESGGGGGGSSGGGGDTDGSTSGGRITRDGVVYVAPLAKITFGPAAKTRKRRPTFRFADTTGQPGTSFFCRVDKRKWAGCSSPYKVKKLKLGRHVFSVRAVNAVGIAGPSPVKRAFKVVGR